MSIDLTALRLSAIIVTCSLYAGYLFTYKRTKKAMRDAEAAGETARNALEASKRANGIETE